MAVQEISRENIFDILKNINIIRAKLNNDEGWVIAPILYSSETSIEIIARPEDFTQSQIELGAPILLKFLRYGNEYIINCRVKDVNISYGSTITVEFLFAYAYQNLRKYTRFDTCLSVTVKDQASISGIVKNISRGGAMFSTIADMEVGDEISLEIKFNSGNLFSSPAKIRRKNLIEAGRFIYGVEFINTPPCDDEMLQEEIAILEDIYFASLDLLKGHSQTNGSGIDSKIAILNFGEETYDIKEILAKLGARNFDTLNSCRFYIDYLIQEKPKIVIIDVPELSASILETVRNIRESFDNMFIIMVLPVKQFEENLNDISGLPNGIKVVYKPLIGDEFEKTVFQYL